MLTPLLFRLVQPVAVSALEKEVNVPAGHKR